MQDYASSGRGGDGHCGPYVPAADGVAYAICPATPGEHSDVPGADACCRHFAYCVPASRFGFARADRVATVMASPRLLALPPGRWRAILSHELGHAADFFLFGSRQERHARARLLQQHRSSTLAALSSRYP